MTEGVDYDKTFMIQTGKICSINEVENDFLERHQDFEVVKIVDLLDNGTRFGIWAKRKETQND